MSTDNRDANKKRNLPGSWKRWKTRWKWRERVQAWDAHMRRLKDEEERETREKEREQSRAWRRDRRDVLIDRLKIVEQQIKKLAIAPTRGRMFNDRAEVDQVKDLKELRKLEADIILELKRLEQDRELMAEQYPSDSLSRRFPYVTIECNQPNGPGSAISPSETE